MNLKICYICGLLVILIFIGAGCKTSPEPRKIDPARFLYEDDDSDLLADSVDVYASESCESHSFQNSTLEEITAIYQRSVEKSALHFVGFQDVVVNGLFQGTFQEQMELLAVVLGGRLYRLNDDFFIVSSSVASDSSAVPDELVSSFVFLSSQDSQNLTALAELYHLKLTSFGAQFVVTGDVRSIVRFNEAVEKLNGNNEVYCLDVAFVELTREEAVNLAADLKTNKVDLFSSGVSLDSLFSAYLSVDLDNLARRDFISETLISSTSKKSELRLGVEHTKEQRSVSDQGTSTVSGYQTVNDGITLTFTPTRRSGRVVVCALEFENSAFQNDGYDTKKETMLKLEGVELEEGRLYYVANLAQMTEARSLALFAFDRRSDQYQRTVWVRVRRVKRTGGKKIVTN